MAKKTKNTKKLDDKVIATIKQLRSHGLAYRDISERLGVGYGTVQKYARNVTFLPKSMRKNPFMLKSPKVEPDLYDKRIINAEDYTNLQNKEYWLEQHVPGERFKAPLHLFSVVELQEIMEEPTGYHSPLSMKDWAVKYLEGPRNFLKHKPHTWGEGQLEIFDLWEEHRKMMFKAHRTFGKTMGVDAILVHEIAENCENNYAICSETDKKARQRVRHVGDMFLKNKKIIADYGFLPHQKIYKGVRQSWTKDQITVKREISQTDPTLMCFSSQSKGATGAHFDGIVFDDVWSRIMDRNPDNKDKWLEWFDGELEGCLENAWEFWIYTRKSPIDLYQTMEDRQYYVIITKPAFIKYPSKYHYTYKTIKGNKVFDKVIIESDDWEISDPSRFTPEEFLEKKLKMNPTEYESEYQLNPMARSGKYWDWKDLRFTNGYEEFLTMLKEKGKRRKARIIGSMDIAVGTSARADYTALCIIGFFERKYYFLELYLKRGANETEIVKILAEAKRTFNDLETVYIEADFQQAQYVKNLQKRASFLHILPVLARQEQRLLEKATPERRNINLNGKALRIWASLEPKIEANTLYVNRYMRNFEEFQAEYKTFPKCEHFDVLDALSSGMFKMEKKGALIFALSG